jgi:toxin ParE1/3/4
LPRIIVSKPAKSDMRAIVRYTVERWGANQAVRYVQGLRSCFEVLANDPGIGRACDSISVGLRRHEHGKHVVFYRLNRDGSRIVRVLHQQMVPAKIHFEQ